MNKELARWLALWEKQGEGQDREARPVVVEPEGVLAVAVTGKYAQLIGMIVWIERLRGPKASMSG